MSNLNACPICQAGSFTVELDVTDWDESEDLDVLTLTLSLDGAVTASKDDSHDGTDAFVYASCGSCGIAVVGEPGDTRLRRAYVRQGTVGEYADQDSPAADITDEQEASLFALVEQIIHTPVPA